VSSSAGGQHRRDDRSCRRPGPSSKEQVP
jgi:hypothetical protein